jgi:hypothetical protein
MKAYVITTGAIFGLVTGAHILRMIMENRNLLTDPVYIALTVLSAALCIWAVQILRRMNVKS